MPKKDEKELSPQGRLHVPTKDTVAIVERLAGLELSLKMIARSIHINILTLKKHYAAALGPFYIDAPEGNSSHIPTKETIAQVELAAQAGMKHSWIAKFIGIAEDTLRKNYKKILDEAGALMDVNVINAMYKGATSKDADAYFGDPRLQIWWSKSRHRLAYTEKIETQQTVEHKLPDEIIYGEVGIDPGFELPNKIKKQAEEAEEEVD